MKRILAILMLLFIGTLFASNAATSIANAKKKASTEKPKPKKKKIARKKEEKPKVLIAKNENPKESLDPDPLHRATWYRTEGTRVHREHPTAAYNHAPRGSFLLVVNEQNGKSCIVEVTDRMGSQKRKSIDLSHKAFGMLASHSHGRIMVKVMPATSLEPLPEKKGENI